MSKRRKHPKLNNLFVISLSSESKHLIGKDAGSSKELDEGAIARQISRRRRRAEQCFKRAQKAYSCSNSDKAREYIKVALEYGAKAYWWSENTIYQDELHEYMHKIAKWNHDTLGCFLEYENGKYIQRCMIAYSHKRFGISPGMYGDKICSLCDEDLAVCPHRTNRTYWIRGGSRNDRNECRICLKKKCQHDSRHLYRTKAIAQMKNTILEEVSIVKYPVQPEMRMVSEFTYSIAEMMCATRYRLEVGQRLSCHACSGPCPGFDELADT